MVEEGGGDKKVDMYRIITVFLKSRTSGTCTIKQIYYISLRGKPSPQNKKKHIVLVKIQKVQREGIWGMK